MRIIHNKITPDKTDPQHEERIVPKEHHYLGTKRLHRGHRMFKYHKGVVSECNENDFGLSEARLNQDGSYTRQKKIIVQSETFYRSSLNIENAAKIFKKMGLTIRILQ